MTSYFLKLQLLSDATFGRGDGVAGLVDQEVEHDQYGFPYLRGRTLKGLLREECENWIEGLPQSQQTEWDAVGIELFGHPGSAIESMAKLAIDNACLPDQLRETVAIQIERSKGTKHQIAAEDILASLTTIRRQTAIDAKTGIPSRGSLRSLRVIIRDLQFTAPLYFEAPPTENMLQLLAISALSLRRVGSGRNRGRGQVRCSLLAEQQDITEYYFHQYAGAAA